MKNKIDNLERKLKAKLSDENTKIHRLASETEELLVISKRGENNSYGFYKPQINELDNNVEEITLTPIENIFDYLEEKKVIMEMISKDAEMEENYGRRK